MNSLHETVRRNIEYFRKQRGLSQKELSQSADYSPSYLGKIERGAADVSLEAMARIASALDVSPEELIQHEEGIEHSMPPPGRELLTSNPVFDFAFQNVDHIVGVSDKRGRTMLINRTFTKHYNQSAEEVFQTDLWSLPFWEFEDAPRSEFQNGLRETHRKRASFLYQLTSPDGPVHVILSHLEDEADQFKYIVFEILWPSARTKGSVMQVEEAALLTQW